MKAFIEISKHTRKDCETKLPFVYAMCKDLVRDSVQKHITAYLKFKQ